MFAIFMRNISIFYKFFLLEIQKSNLSFFLSNTINIFFSSYHASRPVSMKDGFSFKEDSEKLLQVRNSTVFFQYLMEGVFFKVNH